MNRNILNQGTKINNNVYVNTISATEPLEITNNSGTSSTISLGGLNSYGTANQIIQVNSAGDGLEYIDKFLEASGGTLKVKSNSSYNYFQIKQDSSSTAGFQMTNNYLATGSTQNAYIYLDPTTNNLNIETNGERIKFANTDIKFINSRNREMLFYDNDIQKLTLNNNGDFLFIQHCNLIEVDTSRRFYEHTPATNLITIGNPQDTISIVNGSATLSLPTSTTALVGTDIQQTLTLKTLTSPTLTTPILGTPQSGNLTNCTFPILNQNTTGNAATATKIASITNSDIVLLNANQTLTLKTLTSPVINNIKNSSTRNIFNYSGTRLTIGNTNTDTVYIDRCSHILVDIGRRFMESKLAVNTLTIGNPTDTISIVNGTGTLSLPISNDTLVGRDTTDTLTNKTLTSPVISSIVNTGTLTLPTLTDTLVGRLTADTLENKTLRLPILYSVSGQYGEPGILSNHNNRTILRYSQGPVSTANLELNNNGGNDILTIYGLSVINSKQNRQVFINTTDNQLEFGNTLDLFKLNHNGFEMKDTNGNIVMSNKLDSTSSKFTTVFGTGADRSFNTVNNTTVSIVNSSGDNFSDCRFRLYNVDLTSTSTSPVIELIQQTGASSSEGAYLFKSANTKDFFIQDSRNIRIEPAYGACANFTTTKCLEFQNANSDIKGITTSTHPHNTTSRMRNIYCNEVVCVSSISQNDSISYQAFNSKYPLTSIRGLNESGYGPADDRNAMLELGTEQQTTANNNIYPIMRINSPAYADSEFYNYIQSNSDLNDYYGWAYSYSGVLDYYLEFSSDYEVITYQDLICKQDVDITGTCVVRGNLIKPFGTFRIKHPIKAEADKNKYLYHSFVESPRADNIYSGKIQLKNGRAIVNLDSNDYYKMTPGTFNKLNKDLRVYVNNNDFDNWDLVKGKIEGNKLIIVSNNPKSNAMIDWQVIGTRQDNEIKASTLTDENGNLITETIEPPKDKDEDKDKNKTRKTKEDKKQDKTDRINHSRFKSLGKRLEKKTKINNGLHTAKKLIRTNPDKKKDKRKIEDNTQTYQLLNKNG
jgi:hypothetical protein